MGNVVLHYLIFEKGDSGILQQITKKKTDSEEEIRITFIDI